MKIIAIIIAIFTLSACKTVPTKPVGQADHDNYFDGQKIEKNVILGSYSKNGKKYLASEKPLIVDHESCLSSSFQGVVLNFGTRPVSDPLSLLQFDADNKMELLTGMLSKNKKKFESKFDAPDFGKNLKEIVKLNKARKNCLKNKGWN